MVNYLSTSSRDNNKCRSDFINMKVPRRVDAIEWLDCSARFQKGNGKTAKAVDKAMDSGLNTSARRVGLRDRGLQILDLISR